MKLSRGAYAMFLITVFFINWIGLLVIVENLIQLTAGNCSIFCFNLNSQSLGISATISFALTLGLILFMARLISREGNISVTRAKQIIEGIK
ncbi:MAG: hypothetical protein NUV67_05115 [archaeon]|nr:hypothetical protein [archaeon]